MINRGTQLVLGNGIRGVVGYGRDKDCGFWTPSVKKFGGKKRVKAVVMTKYGF